MFFTKNVFIATLKFQLWSTRSNTVINFNHLGPYAKLSTSRTSSVGIYLEALPICLIGLPMVEIHRYSIQLRMMEIYFKNRLLILTLLHLPRNTLRKPDLWE